MRVCVVLHLGFATDSIEELFIILNEKSRKADCFQGYHGSIFIHCALSKIFFDSSLYASKSSP
jgi:hypothetical protein